MRNTARTGVWTAVLLAAACLGGCRDIERHFAEIGMLHVEHERASAARPAKYRKANPRRVIKPKVVAAGNRIRQFCGQRHVRFQTGRLMESQQEKARNDVLCSQS